MIEIVEKLIQQGDLHKLMCSGLVSPKVLFYRNVYNEYLSNKEKRKKCSDCITQATFDTAETFKVTPKTVIVIRKIMAL